ncbi:hypothetical protein H072_3351 [Dactylellina haptotyla CBS 200.50]|uniref:Uncharacterized protein n=1 Tax=Dactylellina haptotyla (strain CBS 200.50) TaxID=1284197 RepID=S8C4M7_DACHA|nr:hypothetical protein H072_3351 [Dactylellina haptotyla CBS 200.50]
MEDSMDIDGPEAATPVFGTRAFVTSKEFHKEIIRKITVLLEEGMNTSAIDFLGQVSYAGLSKPSKPGRLKEIAIPSPDILSIVTTISLHPSYTTRQTGLLQLDGALKASRYMRNIIRLAGATNCQLQQAWRFKRGEANAGSDDNMGGAIGGTRNMRNRNVAKTGAAGRKGKRAAHDLSTAPFASLAIANDESLFKRCDDIWSVIGWALITSCCYSKRWDVWKDFLDLLLETLQNDFQERINAAGDNAEDMDLEGSLVNAIGFIPDVSGSAGYKRVVRAIFANGSEKSRNEWVPVFPRETKKPPKKEKTTEWKTKVDANPYAAKKGSGSLLATLDENTSEDYNKFRNNVNDASDAYREFRDELAKTGYADDEDGSDEDIEFQQLQKEDKSKLETDQEAIRAWGGTDSIIIRLKLMALVSVTGAAADLYNKKQQRLQNEIIDSSRKSRQRSKIQKPTDGRDAKLLDPPLETKMADLKTEESPSSGRAEEAENSLTSRSPPPPLSQNVRRPSDKNTTLPHPSSSLSHSSTTSSPFNMRYNPPTLLESLPRNLKNQSNPPDKNNLNNLQISWMFYWDESIISSFVDEFIDHIRSLPVKQMNLFLSPTIYQAADPFFRTSLLTAILQKSMVWQPRNGWTSDQVGDEALVECYLPHFARGQDVENQVRMATALEYLVRLLHIEAPEEKGLKWSERMEDAMEAGIKARKEKAEAAFRRKKKPTAADEELVRMLDMTAFRLRFLMGQAKTTTLERRKKKKNTKA